MKENIEAEAQNIVSKHTKDGVFDFLNAQLDINVTIQWLSQSEYVVFVNAFTDALSNIKVKTEEFPQE